MYLMIHETTISALDNILKVNTLFKSSKLQELGIKAGGQGTANRKLTVDPKVSLTNPKDFYKKYDEVDGVYFRLLSAKTPIEVRYGGDCILVFSSLVESNPFVINTEENSGFCIAEDGVVAESQLSGEEGMTISNLKNLDILKRYKFDPYVSEVCIMDNVSLNYLLHICVKKDLITPKLKAVCNQRNIQLLMT